MSQRKNEIRQHIKVTMEKHQDKLFSTYARVLQLRQNDAPDQILYRLASTHDEQLYDQLLEAQKSGKLIEFIMSEPRLRKLADKLK